MKTGTEHNGIRFCLRFSNPDRELFDYPQVNKAIEFAKPKAGRFAAASEEHDGS